MKNFIALFVLGIFLASCHHSEEVAIEVAPDEVGIVDEEVIVEENEVEEIEIVDIEEDEVLPALDLSSAVFSWNGTEPFWGFSASGTTLQLREASISGPMDITTYTGVTMTNVGTWVNMTASGMTLDLVLGTCSDGMSDIVYDYSSSFVWVNTYTGCANLD